MRLTALGLAAAILVLVSCKSGGSAPPAATPAPPPAHWTAKVCTAVKDQITLRAGPSSDDTDVFGHWQAGDGQISIDLPARVQQLSQVFVRAETMPDNKVANICLLFDGRPKKAFNFSGLTEDHLVKSSDTDDTSCRCR
jgi:hypothetical protein